MTPSVIPSACRGAMSRPARPPLIRTCIQPSHSHSPSIPHSRPIRHSGEGQNPSLVAQRRLASDLTSERHPGGARRCHRRPSLVIPAAPSAAPMDTRFRGYEGTRLSFRAQPRNLTGRLTDNPGPVAQAARRVHLLAGFFDSALPRSAQNDMWGGPSRLNDLWAGPSRLNDLWAGPSRLNDLWAGRSRLNDLWAGPSRLNDLWVAPSSDPMVTRFRGYEGR